jgi:hypothetical protein
MAMATLFLASMGAIAAEKKCPKGQTWDIARVAKLREGPVQQTFCGRSREVAMQLIGLSQ